MSRGGAPHDLGQGSDGENMAVEAIAQRVAELVGESRVEPLLDQHAAGELLSVPASWLMAEARARRVPHVRFGQYVRFDRDELLLWMRARMEGPRVRRTGSGPVSRAKDRP